MLGAPVPAPAPETSTGVTEPEPVGAEPGDGPPIFESVRSGYLHAFGRDPLRFSEHKPANRRRDGPPGRRHPGATAAVVPWPGPDSGPSGSSEPPTASSPASSGLPQRIPQPGQVRGAAVDQETRPASAAESAEITRSKLASFQRGSRRARTVAKMNRSAKQPGQDG